VMGWRDKYREHPAAAVFPLMEGEELDALTQDIRAHGVRVPIGLFVERDANGGVAKTWLIDGRNRLEAAERAGVKLEDIPEAHVDCSNPVTWIIALNIRRRHLTKQQQADLIVAAVRASRQDGEVVKRHVKGKSGSVKDAEKAEAVATGKEVGVSKRTIERSLPTADEGKQPSKPSRKRRTDAEIERDHLLGGVSGVLRGIHYVKVPDAALDLLTKEQVADLAEDLEEAMATLGALRERLRHRLEPEAA